MSTVLPENSIARWLLVFILIAAIYFFGGFVVPVLAALIIGFASWPLYERLLEACHRNNVMAATIALLVIITVLVIPIALAFSYAIEEVKIWMEWLVIANQIGRASCRERVEAPVGAGSFKATE